LIRFGGIAFAQRGKLRLAAPFSFQPHCLMHQAICVYCSSSDAVARIHFAVAEEMGALLAQRKRTLIYGGGSIGLMGALAKSVHKHGGRVVGVIPKFLRFREVVYEGCDELIVTDDMRGRKAVMEARASAFVALPGGFGTLEEILEVLTLKQLRTHQKPIVLVNSGGFFDRLLGVFDQLYDQNFTKRDYRSFYQVVKGPAEVFAHLEAYQPPAAVKKWF
jgi:uncharacterized protein (TIGR00730 family)